MKKPKRYIYSSNDIKDVLDAVEQFTRAVEKFKEYTKSLLRTRIEYSKERGKWTVKMIIYD